MVELEEIFAGTNGRPKTVRGGRVGGGVGLAQWQCMIVTSCLNQDKAGEVRK